MFNNFIFITSYDLKQLGYLGLGSLSKEMTQGWLWYQNIFPLAPSLMLCLFTVLRGRKLKQSYLVQLKFFNVFFHISSCLSHYLGFQKVMSLRQTIWKMKCIVMYFQFFFYPLFSFLLSLLTVFLRTDVEEDWTPGLTCISKRDTSNWIDKCTRPLTLKGSVTIMTSNPRTHT